MVPRPDVTALPASTTLAEFEQAFSREGYSRIPVYGDDLDDIHGFVHAKDLLQLSSDVLDQPLPPEMLRSLLVVPESARVDRLLEDMRRNRNHLALVIDEHGGTAGIVTMEDIVEEVVGEIRDEHDTETDGVRRVSANRWIIDASMRPTEVRRAVDLDLPEGEYDTMSGFVMERIGRIPRVGDRIEEEDWTMRVRSMVGRRVGEVDVIAKRTRDKDE
jgi:CBS domain containing-hemolysin-like protein